MTSKGINWSETMSNSPRVDGNEDYTEALKRSLWERVTDFLLAMSGGIVIGFSIGMVYL